MLITPTTTQALAFKTRPKENILIFYRILEFQFLLPFASFDTQKRTRYSKSHFVAVGGCVRLAWQGSTDHKSMSYPLANFRSSDRWGYRAHLSPVLTATPQQVDYVESRIRP